MTEIKVPYASWYGDSEVTLTFPNEWNVIEAIPEDAAPLSEGLVELAFRNPIGSRRISELAESKENAVLIVDDLTRPTPASRLLPYILKELKAGGIDEDDTKVVMATAAHRPQDREDLEKKLGEEALSKLEVFNHNPYDNLEYLGVSRRGTPIYINKYVCESELKIGVGGIYPHGGAGYGGGGKIILPGVSGIETMEANHKNIRGAGHGIIENNENRADIEEVAGRAGLDVIVNVVINSKREIAGVFVGDFIKAHREGVKLARKVYRTNVPKDMDVVVVNAYPLDTELFQAVKALWAARESAKDDATIILFAACSEGRGYHALYQKGGRLWVPPDNAWLKRELKNRRLWIVSPNVSVKDVYQNYPQETMLFRSWNDAIEELQTIYKKKINVAVFPCAPIQIS